MTRLYVAGPMRGVIDLNFPAFHRAAATLRAAGYDVVNPAELGEHPGWEWRDYMRRDIVVLVECDGVAVLPAWSMSPGARLEVHVAEQLEMTVQSVEYWLQDARDHPFDR